MKPYRLFHSIGLESEESAAVRKYIVDHGFMEQVEFSNIAHEENQQPLRTRIGVVEAPVMFAGDKVIRGRLAILEFLKHTTAR